MNPWRYISFTNNCILAADVLSPSYLPSEQAHEPSWEILSHHLALLYPTVSISHSLQRAWCYQPTVPEHDWTCAASSGVRCLLLWSGSLHDLYLLFLNWMIQSVTRILKSNWFSLIIPNCGHLMPTVKMFKCPSTLLYKTQTNVNIPILGHKVI